MVSNVVANFGPGRMPRTLRKSERLAAVVGEKLRACEGNEDNERRRQRTYGNAGKFHAIVRLNTREEGKKLDLSARTRSIITRRTATHLLLVFR